MKTSNTWIQDNQLLEKLSQVVLDNLENDQFGVEVLSKEVGISRSHLHRKLKLLRGQSVSQFIRVVRLEKAKELIQREAVDTSISEIAYLVGFNSVSYFNKCFREYYGFSPRESRNRLTEAEKSQAQESKITDEALRAPSRLKSPFKYRIVVSLALIILLSLAGYYTLWKKGTPAIREKSIAVLPFKNLSSNEENKFFTDGLVSDLLHRLSRIKDLKVISQTSSDMYREKGARSIPQIAEELGVSYIIEGSVWRRHDQAKIYIRLIDAQTDVQIWSRNFDRDLNDIFEIQNEIATRIATDLNTVLNPGQLTELKKNLTENIRALELYQSGRAQRAKQTAEGYRSSIQYFEQAIAEDPGYGLAYAGLAETYNLMTIQGWMEKSIGIEKITDLTLKAVEVDGGLAEAYAAMASIYSYTDYDRDAAETAFLRAIELNPNYATAYQFYAEHLNVSGRQEEARRYINKALELDPASFVIRYVSAKLYYNQSRFEEAFAEIQRCHNLYQKHPDFPASLFQSDDVLKISLRTEWTTLLNEGEDEQKDHSGMLHYFDEVKGEVSLSVELRVRGNFRRKKANCSFPPLLLKFDSVDVSSTIFSGHDQLKLITHCQTKEEVFEQYLLVEYFIYKMYNQLSDYSFKVRLLEISYFDEDRSTDSLVRYAILIENKQKLAARLGGEIVEAIDLQPERLNSESLNKLALFQYFIGNSDWSIPRLHNIVLVGGGASAYLHPIPYDFDFSGLVNPPYARPDEQLNLASVTERIFRGDCLDEEEFEKNFQQFRNQKARFESIIDSPELLDNHQKKLAQVYMDQFYNTINHPEKVKLALINTCRMDR